jgi:hypothetical protein
VIVATLAGRDLVSRALYALIALIVVTPTLYPWYLIWTVPLLTLRPHPAMIALCALTPLTHVAAIRLYETGVWEPALWPTIVSYGAFYGLLIAGALRERVSSHRTAA